MGGSCASVEVGVKPESQEGEGVRTRADERRGEAGSIRCSRRVAAKVAAPCCDDFAAAYVVSNGGGSERTGGEEVGGFGGEAVGVEIRVWSSWEEREKQRLGVCSWWQVRRVGHGAKYGARGAVGRGVDEAGGGLFGGGGGKVDGGGQGGKPVVGAPKLGGVASGEVGGAAAVEVDQRGARKVFGRRGKKKARKRVDGESGNVVV